MRFFFLVIISGLILISGCGTNSSQNTNNGEVEEHASLEEVQTFVEAKQEKQALHITLLLQNNSSEDVKLTFSSGQQFEIIVLNDKNEEVYRFSKDKTFTQAIETKVLKEGSQMKWHDVWKTSNVQTGPYQIKGQITISESSPKISADKLSDEISIQVEENEVN
ncbi:BsuPI-related putative proteinase inhibitor [Bacillus taeanensis]|uniref:Intracellular proteinase inhibitor BsuPI domain-containing protein n=1 Tax=Bacillus taeanensis TaxID=273032 RepID=A0A366XXK8_9BACI|nr:BsuPI-related putative proteinase inhibitor [Bacillus taeanensis]RBW69519.1 hypothetical protein DS031_11400 [Bacillus taeanensis]